MYTKQKKKRVTELGTVLVCLFAVGMSLFSIFSTYRLRETATMIYDHPYTVSNEARAMRSRLLDMRGFLLDILAQPSQDTDGVMELFDQRYAMQYGSIQVITSQYLGPEEDVAELLAAMQDLEKTQDAAVPFILPLEAEETNEYVKTYLYPKYDAVNDALMIIINFADKKIQGLEKDAVSTAVKATISAVLLTVFLPGYFIVVFWRERRNMREIRYREHLFDVLANNVDEVFLIFNNVTNALEYVSPNIDRILGIEDAEFIKEPGLLAQQVVEEDRPIYDGFSRPSGNQAGNLEIKNCEVRAVLTPGETHWIRLQAFPEVADRKAVRYIVSISDQTENKRREQVIKDALVNAQSANAAKQNFLSRMSHEIRTPMNAIIGMTTIAAAHIEDRKRVADCLEKIGYSSKHLMTLINDVLDMSKIDEGKISIAHEAFNLEGVAESITSIIYPQAVEKGLNFTIPLVDVTDTVLIGDSLRLNQVLLNLLSNALKFTPSGGSIRMEIRQLMRKNGRVRFRFTVSDTGIGMSKEFMKRLYLPFEQENTATGRKYGGTGLGMAISQNLVSLMGGTLSVSSEINKGSTFTVELDFDIAEEIAESSAHNQQTLNALKVLIADDDRDTCIHTSLLLSNLGIVSQWVLSGEECVTEVTSAHRVGEDYDICFVDWRLPDMDGVEVTRRIRRTVGPETTIVIITAYDWSSIEQSAREAGANAFLSKPFFASTLYNMLLSVTGIEKAVQPYGEQSSYPSLANHRVLLAEDNDLNREIAVELLSMAGIKVTCASDGQEAVNMYLSHEDEYDLILMDIQMPVMDGYQATKTIRNSGSTRAQTIPIVAMTADAFHEDVVKSNEAGMNGHLSKPIDAKRLYKMIENVLDIT
jgi:signal transduction histidine kinase/CheY-like chemotaxis protein